MEASFILSSLALASPNKSLIYITGVVISQELVEVLGKRTSTSGTFDPSVIDIKYNEVIAEVIGQRVIVAVLERAFENGWYEIEPELSLLEPWPISMKAVSSKRVEVSLILSNDTLEPIRGSAQL
jgi:hypothetical protein